MKSSVLFAITITICLIALSSVPTTSATSYVRYANTALSFGDADVAGLSNYQGNQNQVSFSDVPPGAFTAYTPVAEGPWKFDANFSRKTSASGNGQVNADQFYTLFTKQNAAKNHVNELLSDGSTNTGFPLLASGAVAIESDGVVRAVNLGSFSYDANVLYTSTSSTGMNAMFSGLKYGVPSDYLPVPAGMYNFEWEVSNAKRGMEQYNRSVIIIRERRYTIWLLPTGPYVSQDAVLNNRRSVSEIRKRRIAQRENVEERAKEAK